MRFSAGIVAALALLAACGPSSKDVIAKYTPQVEALRTKVLVIVDKLPAPGKVDRTAPFSGQPQLFYDGKIEDSYKRSNIAFLPLDTLKGEMPKHNFILSSYFDASLARVTDEYIAILNPDGAGFSEDFDAALATRFVGVYREVEYTKSTLIDEKTFDPGHLVLETFIIDLSNDAVIADCLIAGMPNDEVNVSKQHDEATWDEYKLADSTHTQMVNNIRDELEKCLTEQTGGKFDFEGI